MRVAFDSDVRCRHPDTGHPFCGDHCPRCFRTEPDRRPATARSHEVPVEPTSPLRREEKPDRPPEAGESGGPTYCCPVRPEVSRDRPDSRPEYGMARAARVAG